MLQFSKQSDLNATQSSSIQREDIGTSVGQLLPEFKTPQELQEEVILLFYDSMLNLVVREWVHVEDDDTSQSCDEKTNGVKDLKDLTKEDLLANELSYFDDSKVSLTSKKSRRSSSGVLSKYGSRMSRRSRTSSKRWSVDRVPSKIDETTSYTLDLSNTSDQYEWVIQTYPDNVMILFKNGNVYKGPVERKRFHGIGTLFWSDGTVYEGEFNNGHITGRGKLYYKDCSYYIGSFCQGLLHGEGCMYITETNSLYSGEWKAGKKNGKGWLLYEPNNWYNGNFLDDQRHGNGIRQYYKECMYQGEWQNGLREGYGTMVWGNHDYYKGDWKNGKMNGYGEYIWKAFFNRSFSYPIMNKFEGYWVEGTRTGEGILNFGFCGGARMTGCWIRNMKHGPAFVICGNGKTMSGDPLFLYDKPVDPVIWYRQSSNELIKRKSGSQKQILNTKSSSTLTLLTSIESHESVSLSAFPKVMSCHINPLCIPIHYEPKQVDLTYFLLLLVKKHGAREHGTIHLENIFSVESNIEDSILLGEEEKLRNVIISNNLVLKHIYYQYAFIATKEMPKFRPVLIRLFFWQLLYDINITTRGMSLIDVDLCVMENPDCGLETEHDPFERIYFWQFLQSLVAIAWKLYGDVFDVDQVEGTLSKILRKFLYDDLLPNVGKNRGTALYEYKDLLPIQGVYMLYRSIGDPPTARMLYQSCIHKGFPACSEKVLEGDEINHLKSGANATPIGSSVIFLADDEIIPKIEDPTPYPFKTENIILKNLHVFTKLKRKRIIDCIAEVCPSIIKNGQIVDLEYPISFLEFYNIILLLTTTKIEDIENYKKAKEASKLKKLSIIESSAEVKKKDKKGKKKK
nr:radial spoke head 10 homolog B-like [Onthophagus taurus]